MGNEGWNWKSMKPYIQKTYTLYPPRLPSGDAAGSAPSHGNPSSGPIQVAYESPANNADKILVDAWNAAFEQHGYEHISDFLAEKKTFGTRAYTAAIDPTSGHRSSADAQHGALLAGRDNVTIMTGATVQRILFDPSADGTVRAIGVEANVDAQLTTLKASKEVILAAGVFHSPKLLELSGIGHATRLRELGINTWVSLPGVGENLQNHIIAGLPVGLKPHPETQGISAGIKAFAFDIAMMGSKLCRRLVTPG
jgi:choline dehydrogenase-like flavoprotein